MHSCIVSEERNGQDECLLVAFEAFQLIGRHHPISYHRKMTTPDKMTQKAVSRLLFASARMRGSSIRVSSTVDATLALLLDDKVALITRFFIFC